MRALVSSPNDTYAGRVFVEALRLVAPFASKEDARPLLTTAHFLAGDGTLTMEATDSYSLLRVKVAADVVLPDGLELFGFNVYAADLSAVLALAAKSSPVTMDVTETAATFTVLSKRHETTMRVPLHTGDYPKLDSLVAFTKGEQSGVAFSNAVMPKLSALAARAKRLGGGERYVAFDFPGSELKAVSFAIVPPVVGIELVGIAMPVRRP